MTYVSVDRGVFTYHVDVLCVSVGLDPISLTSMKMNIKTLQGEELSCLNKSLEKVWSQRGSVSLSNFI